MRQHTGTLYRRVVAFNTVAALRITSSVGSMWCAYVFMALALLGFPGVGATPTQYVQWVSQTFLQLVLLSVIMVGQNVQEARAEKRHHAQEARMERLESTNSQELKEIRELVADLHSHTQCTGHTVIVSPAEQLPPPILIRKHRS